MAEPEPTIRDISDTARWAAIYRARETERPDALFRDPFARRLAGERGQRIFESLPERDRNEWAWVMRTALFDRFLAEEVERGADLVLNLAAGLDARPYRMKLPARLLWVEVDLPQILAYKEEVLGAERPACLLERVRLDLADLTARRALFATLARRAKKAVVVTEGLLIYLAPSEVALLAQDLAAAGSFSRWVLDIASPGLRRMLERRVGSALTRAGAPFRFAPEEGPHFFEPQGWRPVSVESTLQTAARAKRLSPFFRLLALLPESSGRRGKRPWSATCLMENRIIDSSVH